jgi:hypothetical protein
MMVGKPLLASTEIIVTVARVEAVSAELAGSQCRCYELQDKANPAVWNKETASGDPARGSSAPESHHYWFGH